MKWMFFLWVFAGVCLLAMAGCSAHTPAKNGVAQTQQQGQNENGDYDPGRPGDNPPGYTERPGERNRPLYPDTGRVFPDTLQNPYDTGTGRNGMPPQWNKPDTIR